MIQKILNPNLIIGFVIGFLAGVYYVNYLALF